MICVSGAELCDPFFSHLRDGIMQADCQRQRKQVNALYSRVDACSGLATSPVSIYLVCKAILH